MQEKLTDNRKRSLGKGNMKTDETSKMILAISSCLFVFVGYYMWNKTGSIWLGIAAWLPPALFTAACIDGIRKC